MALSRLRSDGRWRNRTSTGTTCRPPCTKASGLRNARPVGEVVTYSDQVGYDALLMSGTHLQPHMKNKKGQALCLFNRTTRWAYATDAEYLTRRQPKAKNQPAR